MTPAEAVRRALAPSSAGSMREIIDALGGPAAAAREAMGIGPKERLPSMADEPGRRREYNALIRQAQRYTTSAGQRRGQGSGAVSTAAQRRAEARFRRMAGPKMKRSYRARLARQGGRMRVDGALIVGGSKDARSSRSLPADRRGQPIPPAAMRRVLKHADAGRWEQAARRLFAAFSSSYEVQVRPDPDVSSSVDLLELRVDGDELDDEDE